MTTGRINQVAITVSPLSQRERKRRVDARGAMPQTRRRTQLGIRLAKHNRNRPRAGPRRPSRRRSATRSPTRRPPKPPVQRSAETDTLLAARVPIAGPNSNGHCQASTYVTRARLDSSVPHTRFDCWSEDRGTIALKSLATGQTDTRLTSFST